MIREAIARFFAAHRIELPLVAVSGGVDSTALLVALAELGVDCIAAHVNHHLRGEESDEDERFVRELCAQRSVRLEVLDGRVDTALVREHGLEGAARDVRFARLFELRERLGLRWIATAHQRDDQAETVLMRLMTGSGLAGLRGIHPLRDDGVIRPMLEFPRERNIAPRVDSTNADPHFLRNRVRMLLRDLPASVSANLAAMAGQAEA